MKVLKSKTIFCQLLMLSVLVLQGFFCLSGAQDVKTLPSLVKFYSPLKYPRLKFLGIEKISSSEVLLASEHSISTYNVKTKQEKLLYRPYKAPITDPPEKHLRIHSFARLNANDFLFVEANYKGENDSLKIINLKTAKVQTLSTNFQIPRLSYTTTALKDGRVLFIGGFDKDQIPLDSIEIFDPKTKTLALHKQVIQPRAGHAAVLLPSQEIVLIGGYPSTRDGDNGMQYAPPIEIFNTANLTTEKGEELSHLMAGGIYKAFLLPGHKIFTTLGLYDYQTQVLTPVENHVDCFLPTEENKRLIQQYYPKHIPPGMVPVGRAHASHKTAPRSYIAYKNNRVLLLGGITSLRSKCDSVALYDGKKEEFKLVGKNDYELSEVITLDLQNIFYIFSVRTFEGGNWGVYKLKDI
jgi:hypothetical protein